MSEPQVSVVIATYNMGQYLGEAIDSVLNQTYRRLDVHVVDDGSTDDTAKIVAKFKKDPRVCYYARENGGQAKAKNWGISSSKGDIVGFCDADDSWMPDKLESQIGAFGDDPQVGVVYSIAVDYEDGSHPESVQVRELDVDRPSGKVTDKLLLNNFVPFGTALVRREALDHAGPFDERYRMGIDWELWLRISLHYEFRFVDKVTYLYRVWPGQMSQNWRGRYEFTFQIMNDFLTNYAEEVPAKKIARAWAGVYASRARVRSYVAREHGAALMDAMHSLYCAPTFAPGWRLLGRIALNSMGLRSP